MRFGKQTRTAWVLAALFGSTMVVPTAAHAFPNDVHEYCGHHDRSFHFNIYEPVTSNARTAISAGLADWNKALDYNGMRLAQWVPWNGDPYIAEIGVHHADLGPNDFGLSDCFANAITINSRAEFQDPALLRTIATHEAGHIAGLLHTGDTDSHGYPSDNPTAMSTCLSPATAATRSVTQDDAQSITFAQTRLARSSLSANMGFEQGISYWGLGGGGYAYVTNGGATGPGFIRYDAGDTLGALFQTTRWADAPAKQLVGTINHSKTAISDVGSIRVELWARSITYRWPNDSDCDYPNGKNMNADDQPVGTWLRRTGTSSFTPSGSGWVKASTPAWTSWASGEQDVRVRVFEDMQTYNGGVSSVRLDNVRLECVTQQSEGDCT